MGQPNLTGSATLASTQITLPDQGVKYRDLHGRLDFQGGRIHIDSLSMTSDGTASFSGGIGLEPLSRPTFDI